MHARRSRIAQWIRAWILEPDCLDPDLSSDTDYLCDFGQVTETCASVFSSAEWWQCADSMRQCFSADRPVFLFLNFYRWRESFSRPDFQNMFFFLNILHQILYLVLIKSVQYFNWALFSPFLKSGSSTDTFHISVKQGPPNPIPSYFRCYWIPPMG